jgi:C-terminal processing protease CtpA/Prc
VVRYVLLAGLLLATCFSVAAQTDLAPAPILNDEGGTRAVYGEMSYTNPYLTDGVAEPLIILEDQAGFVDRDRDFTFSPESQVMGRLTSDFFASPVSYVLQLPFEPQGSLRDVDNDGEEDGGVQIFAVAFWTNIWGPPELEERDLGGGGWSTAYASTDTSNRSQTLNEVIGGQLLVYAPDDEQGFPSGYGEDGLLFTEDDPTVGLPAGYTLVSLDSDPFTFDRSAEPVVNLIEGEASEADDFSEMDYTAAFDAMLDKFRREYAFTEYKGIDWDAMSAEFRPRFEQALADDDPEAYEFALRDFAWSIPDSHVGVSFGPAVYRGFREAIAGGVGIAFRELDDGRIVVNFLLEDSPAAAAGIELRAEILEINGQPAAEYVSETVAWSEPFSLEEQKRLQQLRYATRFPADSEVEISWRNPGAEEISNAELPTSDERDSFDFSSFFQGRDRHRLPLEFEEIEGSDFTLVQIHSFSDNERLTIDLWERLIEELNYYAVPGLVIDMRSNGGGSGWLAQQMAAYFFNEPHVLGNSGFYDEDTEDFFFDPDTEDDFILPPEDLRYDGEVAVLVYSSCYSACEFFSYYMTVEDRAAIVGHTATAGAGGSVETFYMPDDMEVTFTVGRAVDADHNIHLEGIGVVPTLRVPVTEETLFNEGDPVLEAAIAWLDGAIVIEPVAAGEIAVGDVIKDQISRRQRLRYTLTLPAGSVTDILLGSEEGDLDTLLNLYDASGETLLDSNDDIDLPGSGSALYGVEAGDEDLIVIVEVTTYNDGDEGEYILEIVDAISEAEEAAIEV